jgi:F-type H+-transporting ATPase subunit epsilon
MTLHVELLMPDRSLWSGEAGLVIAKTLEGDIGVQTGHSPVFGILSPGSLVRIREVPGDDNPGDVVRAAVRENATAEIGSAAAAEESADVRYARARLRAAGDQA